jgi:hypothetical protein
MSLLDTDPHIINTIHELARLCSSTTTLLQTYSPSNRSLHPDHHYAIQLRAQYHYLYDKIVLYICKQYMYTLTAASTYIMRRLPNRYSP